MDFVSKLPGEKGIVGTREIAKNVKAGKIKHIVVAKNCPDFLIQKVEDGARIETFDGDESQLGTKLGKPFPVAMVGYECD